MEQMVGLDQVEIEMILENQCVEKTRRMMNSTQIAFEYGIVQLDVNTMHIGSVMR